MLCGYLTHALFMDEPNDCTRLSSRADVYEGWIPVIYISNPSEMKEGLQKALGMCTDSSEKALKAFFKEHDMKGGGFLTKGKGDAILAYYCVAGFGLRFIEVGKDPRRD